MRRFFRGRFFVILVLLICFLLGFLLNLLVDGGKMPHQQVIGTVIAPVRSGFSWCAEKVSRFFKTFSEYDALTEENAELRRQVADLQKDLSEAYYDKVQNERYRQMLSVTEPEYSFQYVAADVVSVPGNGWNYTFGINAGSRSGIARGNVVVSESGLVGKVIEVGLNWATVSCFIDPQISVGAMVLSTGDVGVTEGTLELKNRGLCRVSYLKRSSTVNRGDVVCTSGLGGVYPKGILLGTVTELVYDDNGLNLSAILQPSVSFSDLKEVFVITDFVEDAP